MQTERDTKGTAKGGEGSAKKDTGVHPQGSNAQLWILLSEGGFAVVFDCRI
ncbi:hypothetical protein QQ045_018936 [Rhodiola kirilowii]